LPPGQAGLDALADGQIVVDVVVELDGRAADLAASRRLD
jgi:hypothetical protein